MHLVTRWMETVYGKNGKRNGKRGREGRRDGWKLWDNLHDWKSLLYEDRISLSLQWDGVVRP